jgi:hypothetical protein
MAAAPTLLLQRLIDSRVYLSRLKRARNRKRYSLLFRKEKMKREKRT